MIMKKKELEGFIALEYTLLVPVLMILYMSLICMGVYLHNQCVLQTNTFILSVEGARLDFQKNVSKTELLQRKAEQLYNNKYLLAVGVETTYQVQGNSIEITSSGQMMNQFSIIGIGERMWNFSAEGKVDVISPVDTLRLCKKAGELLQNISVKEENADDLSTGVCSRESEKLYPNNL